MRGEVGRLRAPAFVAGARLAPAPADAWSVANALVRGHPPRSTKALAASANWQRRPRLPLGMYSTNVGRANERERDRLVDRVISEPAAELGCALSTARR